ncbi:type I restriction enzyme S subunit [Nitrobacteraceae bacterium AZCC 2146]
MSLSRYDSYKDSGVEVLGNVPRHWRVVSLKRIVDPSFPITYGVVQCGPHVVGGIPYIRPTDMCDEVGVINEQALLRTSEEIVSSYARSALQVGELVCSIGPSFGKVMIVPPSLVGANLTQGTARIAVAKEHVSRFFFWVLRSMPSFHQWESSVGGATFRALNLGPLSETIVCVPNFDEQIAIAAFLDRETSKIDELVEEQRQLAELLKEKRQALISHAVTKGLNPSAPMKDSGVEWLREVPEHWEIKRLKKVIQEGSSISYGIVQPGEPQEAGVPFIQTTNMTSGAFELESLQRTTQEIASAYPRSQLRGGEVILGIRASIGAAHVVSPALAGMNLSRGVARIACGSSLLSTFLVKCLRGQSVEQYWQLSKQGSTFNEVSIDTVRELAIAVPPLNEQQDIVTYLESEVARFDNLISEVKRATGLLRERRAALISAAVTGKIDLRGLEVTDEPVLDVVAA